VRLQNRRFAVRVLHPEYAQQSAIVARFQREAEASSGIGHPNVVDVYDLGRAPDGRPYIVSEFLDGRDFSALLEEQGRIEPPAAVRIVRQVCRALGAAHDRGVVHRDVKPENVFLVGDPLAPIVKVLDFGISKFEGGSGGVTLTQTGMIMGTPGYMPPEQARGAKTDHRADIYGVGAMLYRAVTGALPFDAEEASEVLGKVLTEDPPRPRSLAPSIPEALELVIQKAMAKEPDERYSSMHELDDALAPFDPETSASLSLMPSAPGSGARPVRIEAATMLAPTARSRSTSDVARTTREAKMARPSLVLLSIVAYVWALACVIDLVTTAFGLFFRRGASIGADDRLVIVVTLATLSITPVVFWLRHVVRAWRNSVHAVALAQLLRRLVLAATVPYAFLALALRLGTQELTDTRWVLVPSGVALFVAFGSYLLARKRRGH
jgi:serine/threonine-protein kinase